MTSRPEGRAGWGCRVAGARLPPRPGMAQQGGAGALGPVGQVGPGGGGDRVTSAVLGVMTCGVTQGARLFVCPVSLGCPLSHGEGLSFLLTDPEELTGAVGPK